jgi:hypothetical protein
MDTVFFWIAGMFAIGLYGTTYQLYCEPYQLFSEKKGHTDILIQGEL